MGELLSNALSPLALRGTIAQHVLISHIKSKLCFCTSEKKPRTFDFCIVFFSSLNCSFYETYSIKQIINLDKLFICYVGACGWLQPGPEDIEDTTERLWCENTVTGGDKAFSYPSKSNSNFSYKLVQCLRNKQTKKNTYSMK